MGECCHALDSKTSENAELTEKLASFPACSDTRSSGAPRHGKFLELRRRASFDSFDRPLCQSALAPSLFRLLEILLEAV